MHRTVIRSFAVASSAALALALAGCGDEKKDDAPAALTAEEFTTQANAICKAQDAAEKTSFDAAQKAGQAGDAATADALLKELAAVIRGEAKAVGALKPPESMASDVEELLKSLNGGLDRIEAEGVNALMDDVLADASAKADSLGLTECAN